MPIIEQQYSCHTELGKNILNLNNYNCSKWESLTNRCLKELPFLHGKEPFKIIDSCQRSGEVEDAQTSCYHVIVGEDSYKKIEVTTPFDSNKNFGKDEYVQKHNFDIIRDVKSFFSINTTASPKKNKDFDFSILSEVYSFQNSLFEGKTTIKTPLDEISRYALLKIFGLDCHKASALAKSFCASNFHNELVTGCRTTNSSTTCSTTLSLKDKKFLSIDSHLFPSKSTFILSANKDQDFLVDHFKQHVFRLNEDNNLSCKYLDRLNSNKFEVICHPKNINTATLLQDIDEEVKRHNTLNEKTLYASSTLTSLSLVALGGLGTYFSYQIIRDTINSTDQKDYFNKTTCIIGGFALATISLLSIFYGSYHLLLNKK